MCNQDILKQIQNGIKLANEAMVQVTTKENVNIIADNGEKSIPYTFTNILHISSLHTNLLSVTKIVDKDLDVILNKNGALIKDNSRNIKLIADRKGDLLYLRKRNKNVI